MAEIQRQASRLIAIDREGRVLLVRYRKPNGESLWATPGGGLESGETFEQAATREAREELGATHPILKSLWESMNTFVDFLDNVVHQNEVFSLLQCSSAELLRDVADAHKKEGIQEAKWWTSSELEVTSETFFPKNLIEKIKSAGLL